MTNIIQGTDELDRLTGTYGDDTLIGGKGDDILSTSPGDDIYIFSAGDGNDTYYGSNMAGSVTFEFTDVKSTDVVGISLSPSSSPILHYTASDSILFGYTRPNFFKFSDGVILTAEQLFQNHPNIIAGTEGNDTIVGTDGVDRITGGKGDDYLDGVTGQDTFIFSKGDGNDTFAILDNFDYSNIAFTDIKSTDPLILNKTIDGRLHLLYTDSDSITFTTNAIPAQFQFSDGITLSRLELLQKLTLNVFGTDGNDQLQGSGGNDIIEGGKGDDTITGSYSGSDTYIFSKGDGNDTYLTDKYNPAADTIILKDVKSTEFVGIDLVSNPEISVTYPNGRDSFLRLKYTLNDSILLQTRSVPTSIQFSDGVTLTIAELTALFPPTYVGTDGNDRLLGSAYGDRITGGKGDDYIAGGTDGADTYVFAKGDGNDLLTVSGNYHANTILFTDVKSTDSIKAFKSSLDGKDTIRIQYTENDSISFIMGYLALGHLQFSDGVTLTLDQFFEQHPIEFIGTDGNDNIFGTNYTDRIEGGKGDDQLLGGISDDTYVFSKGDGNDLLADQVGMTAPVGNKVEFKDVKSTDFVGIDLAPDGYLRLNYTATDSFRIPNLNHLPVSFAFSDGVTLSSEQLLALFPITLKGTDGNDTITGGSYGYNELIIGGKGDDTLAGRYGDDTYFFSRGDGNDIYNDIEGTNKLVFKDVQSTEFVGLTGLADGSIQLNYSPTDSITLINGSLPASLQFSDGISLTTDQLFALYPINYIGTDGSDSLSGSTHNDRITGAKGDDSLGSSAGNDTYVFSAGDGNDTFNGSSGSNIFEFKDVKSTDFVGIDHALNGNLILKYTASDSITLSNLPPASFKFSDGVTLTADQLFARFPQTFTGTDGNDTITGTGSNDRIIGGKGDDQLAGGAGNDSYVFSRGDGNDTYSDNLGVNSLVFTDVKSTDIVGLEGLPSGAVRFKYTNTDSVIIQNAVQGNYVLPSIFQFSDGVTLTSNQIVGQFSPIKFTGTSAADILLATTGSDILEGGQGDDFLFGGNGIIQEDGNDTFIFSKGDGNDILYDRSAANTVIFKDVKSTEILSILTTDFQGAADSALKINYTASDSITIAKIQGGVIPTSYQFSDGVTLTSTQLLAQYGTAGDASTQVHQLVSALASFAPPAAAQESLRSSIDGAPTSLLLATVH